MHPKPVQSASIARNNIKVLRRLCRMSQPEIAFLMSKYLGTVLDTTTISKHEAMNSNRPPSPDEVTVYATIFKVPTQAIYADLYDEAKLIQLLQAEGDWWSDITVSLKEQ